MSDRTSGYHPTIVAASLKASVATVAALTALFGGVGVAQAGGLPGVGDPVPVDAAPVPDVDPGPVVEEAVDEVTETAGQAVEDATQTVDEAVNEVPETADAAAAAVESVVSETPVAGVVSDVEQAVEPVVGKVEKTVGAVAQAVTGAVPVIPPADAAAPGAGAPAPGAAEAAPGAAEAALGAPSTSPTSKAATSSALQLPTTALGQAEPGGPAIAPDAATSSAAQGDADALLRTRAELTVTTGAPADAPLDDNGSAKASAPWAPFAPSFPVNTIVTAVATAGAAGGALFAALLCAFTFLAPRTGYLARPGPILVRPDPCLSLVERPG